MALKALIASVALIALLSSHVPSPAGNLEIVSASQISADQPEVGLIKELTPIECGCHYWFPTKDKQPAGLVLNAAQGGNVAQMHIDGEDVNLGLLNRRRGKSRPQVGQKFSEEYGSDKFSVKAVYTITEKSPLNFDCNDSRYSVLLTVTNKADGSSRQVNLVGMCGC